MKNIAYIDGSFNAKKDICGGGAVLFDRHGTEHDIKIKSRDPNLTAMRNVGGEILGAYAAIQMADDLGMETLKIVHDYSGIGCWGRGDWKTNKPWTKWYHKFVKSTSEDINISFEQVKGHSGNELNDKADLLAKEACGLV